MFWKRVKSKNPTESNPIFSGVVRRFWDMGETRRGAPDVNYSIDHNGFLLVTVFTEQFITIQQNAYFSPIHLPIELIFWDFYTHNRLSIFKKTIKKKKKLSCNYPADLPKWRKGTSSSNNHLWKPRGAEHMQPWSRWADPSDDHTWCPCGQLRHVTNAFKASPGLDYNKLRRFCI